MMRLLGMTVALGLAVFAAGPAPAQSREETLADIRQQLTVVYVDVQRLKRELSTTGGATGGLAGGSVLQRIDAIEAELQRLTAKSEELEFRINQVVTDGTRRVGDLEFRLCELEKGCDVSKLGDTPTLGGGALPAAQVQVQPSRPAGGGGAELAIGEQADFDRARETLQAGKHQEAAAQFAAFTQTYPGGPLSGEAHYLRGQALSAQGQSVEAAKAYLESFSGSPDGPVAPDALYQLGMSISALGQTSEACQTLGQVGERYPTSAAAAQARTSLVQLGCR